MEVFTKRQRYLIILSQCSHIERPSLTQLGAICPHLAPNQVAWLHRTPGKRQFALPPLSVRGLFQVAEYSNIPGQHHLRVSAQAEITTKSHALYRARAIAHAETYWPDELSSHKWVDALTIYISDTPRPHRTWSPQPSKVYVGISCKWETIFSKTDPLRRVIDFNNAIETITSDPFEGSELVAVARREYTGHNCGSCGNGLTRQTCSNCQHGCDGISSTWDTPLPPRIVEFLQANGHRFSRPPSHLYM